MSDNLYYHYPSYIPVNDGYKFSSYPNYAIPVSRGSESARYPMVMSSPASVPQPPMVPTSFAGLAPMTSSPRAMVTPANSSPASLSNFSFSYGAGPVQPKQPKRKRAKSSPSHLVPLTNKFSANPMYNVLSSDRSPRGYSYSFATNMQPITMETETNRIKYPICQLPVTSASSNIPLDKSNDLKNKIYPQIEIKKYSTSAIDPLRNYLIVFEYQISNHWIIWDYETGFVHLTGIWKASLNDQQSIEEASLPKSNSKADIVKLLESTPKQYHPYIKRIRGGFLKIQGTWLPYNLCKVLARRFCYYIRYELIPIFGVDFPDYCLKPTDYGFGELKLDEVPDENSVFNGDIVIDPKKTMTHRKTKSTPIINTNMSNYMMSGKEHKKKNSLPLVSLLPLPPTNLVASPEMSVKKTVPLTPEINRYSLTPAWSPEGGNGSHRQHNWYKTPLQQTPNHDISYNDMVDIVNASKCLQSLSRSGSLQTSPISYHETSSNKDYTTSPKSESTGILTILVAAGVSEPCNRRASMKINDLLS